MTATRGIEGRGRHELETRWRALTADIADLERTRRLINIAVWGIALGVMIYGAINVTALLIDHGVWVQVAWLLSVMIDLAMCVALMGDRVLHRYGRRDGWVTALRWLTAVMTLVLNTTRPALAHDWVGVGIHTAGPVLLMLVAEGASSFQRQLTAIIRDLQTQLRQLGDAAKHGTETANLTGAESSALPAVSPVVPGREPSRAIGITGLAASRPGAAETPTHATPPIASLGDADPGPEFSTAAAVRPAATDVVQPERPNAATGHSETFDGSDRSTKPRDVAHQPTRLRTNDRATTRRESMWQHWLACRAAGYPVTGAELDRVFGTNNYGRRVINEWVLAGRITSADVAAARAGLTPATAA
jgi:hypothetical protein